MLEAMNVDANLCCDRQARVCDGETMKTNNATGAHIRLNMRRYVADLRLRTATWPLVRFHLILNLRGLLTVPVTDTLLSHNEAVSVIDSGCVLLLVPTAGISRVIL